MTDLDRAMWWLYGFWALCALLIGGLVLAVVTKMARSPQQARQVMDRAAADQVVGVRPDGRAEGTWQARVAPRVPVFPGMSRLGVLRLVDGRLSFTARDGAERWTVPVSAVTVSMPSVAIGPGSTYPLRLSVPGVGHRLMVEVSLERLHTLGEGDLKDLRNRTYAQQFADLLLHEGAIRG